MLDIIWIRRMSHIYLGLPILIFLFGWLNGVAALLVAAALMVALINLWRTKGGNEFISFTKIDWGMGTTIVLFWLFLSGVGGYFFQNWDHHSRNALFRDLIEYSWPVIYHLPADVAEIYSISPSFNLSYYFGFWLPSALVGKLLGWNIANFFLLLWSFIGVFLAVILTASKIRLTLLKTTLLIMFFSGMDVLGALLFQGLPQYDYPKPFPPIQHLEWWAGSFGFLQYSSFTTDLFWTYNQFIPALLVLALFVTASSIRSHVLLTGVCLFFAPLPALGLSLYVAGSLLTDFYTSLKNDGHSVFDHLLQLVFTIENFFGLVIGMISLLFFSTNLAGEERSFGLPAPLLLFVIFTIFEWLVLWVLLLPANKQNWMWYLTGVILFLAPFINFGGSWDFMMRATIPSFYFLMLGCGVHLASGSLSKTKFPILILLVFGGFTALYEMNRSLARFVYYYDLPVPSAISLDVYFEAPPAFGLRFVPELNHPDTLVADEWISISIPNDEGWVTKVGELFPASYRFLWKEELLK